MNKPLVYYCISLIVGVLSFLLLNFNILGGAVFTASFLLILFFTIDKRFFILCTCFLAAGFISSYEYFDLYIPKNCSMTIRVTDKSNFYSVASYKGRKFNLQGKLLTSKVGDLIKIRGEFDRKLDYENGVLGNIKIISAETLKGDFISHMYDFRRRIYKEFYFKLGDKKAGFIMSLCFGDTSYLADDYKQNLKDLGIIHAVSVSGMHIAIIYEVIEGFLGTWVSMFIALLYVVFTGALPATIRSFIMIAVLKLSYRLYKKYDALSSLAFSAIVILLVKPFYILNIGFVLSYLATLGILLFYKNLSRKLYKLPKKLNESLSLTFSAQIFSVPYAAFVLNSFSGGFILGNLIIVPFYSIIVLLGNAGLFLFKFRHVFQGLCDVINVVIDIIDFITGKLLIFTPKMVYVSPDTAISIAILFFCFFLIKRGVKKLKYFPLIIAFTIFLQIFIVFPEIDYVNLKGKNAIALEYRGESVLLTNNFFKSNNDKINIQSKLGIKHIVSLKGKWKAFILGKEYRVVVNPLMNNLDVYCGNDKIFQSNNDIAYRRNYFNRYDIIKMPLAAEDKYSFAEVKLRALIVLGKVIVLKGD